MYHNPLFKLLKVINFWNALKLKHWTVICNSGLLVAKRCRRSWWSRPGASCLPWAWLSVPSPCRCPPSWWPYWTTYRPRSNKVSPKFSILVLRHRSTLSKAARLISFIEILKREITHFQFKVKIWKLSYFPLQIFCNKNWSKISACSIIFWIFWHDNQKINFSDLSLKTWHQSQSRVKMFLWE